MKKIIYLTFLLFVFVTVTITLYASTNDRMPNNVIPGDYQKVTVYKISKTSSENDSTASYTSRSALYYPMDGTVVIGGSHYGVESNPYYNENKEPTSDFRYIVGSYYTNLD